MKKKEIDYELYYEISEIRRTGITRLRELDGVADRVADIAHGTMAAIRAVFREAMR